jgi:hypothetical protein
MQTYKNFNQNEKLFFEELKKKKIIILEKYDTKLD